MMKIPCSKYNVGIKTIATVVVCLFLVNDIVWANPNAFQPAKTDTLARWLATKALTDAGVEDPTKVELEAVTGIDFFARGMEVQTVNSILTENATRAGIKSHIGFLSCERNQDGSVTARFCLLKDTAVIFDVSRDKNERIALTKISPASLKKTSKSDKVSEEDISNLDATFRTFENNHELLEVLNRVASGRPSEEEQGKGFRQREDKDRLRLRFTLLSMAELTKQISNKKLMTKKIIREFERAPIKLQEGLLYDLADALSQAASDADEGTKTEVTDYLQKVLLPRVQADGEITRRYRNLVAIANALTIIHVHANDNEKAKILEFIQEQILQPIDTAISSTKQKLGIEDIIAKFLGGTQRPTFKMRPVLGELKTLLMTKGLVLNAMGQLYKENEPSGFENATRMIRDRLFGQVIDLGDEQALAAAFLGLSESYSSLFKNASLPEREQAWAEWMKTNVIQRVKSFRDVQEKSKTLGSIYEGASRFFERRIPQEDAVRIFEKIKDEIVAPSLLIEDEIHRSITLSRIATSLANLSKRQGPVYQEKIKNYLLIELPHLVETPGRAGYIRDEEARSEGVSKISRAANSIFSEMETGGREKEVDNIISSQKPLLQKFAGYEGPLSRVLAGNANALAEICQNGTEQDRQYAVRAIEQHILPQIFAFKNPRSLFRGAVRTASAIALLYKHASIEERITAVTFIKAKIIEPALKVAKGETFYLRNLIDVYRALNSLTAGEIGQAADFESLSPERATAFAKQLDQERRRKLFVYLGNYASKELILKYLSDPDISGEDKMCLIYGRLIFEKIFPPFNTPVTVYQVMDEKKIEKLAGKIASDAITSKDIYEFSSYVGVKLSLKGWYDIAMNLDFIANDPLANLILIRNIIVTMRLKSDRGEPWLKALDIEKIPMLVRKSLEKIFSDPETAALAYPDLRFLVKSMPLDSALINAVRNIINQWYQDAYKKSQEPGKTLDELKSDNGKAPDSFMTTIRVQLHDSPSPYHLKIVRAYVDYLKSIANNEKSALAALNETLKPFNVVVPEDYARRIRQRDNYSQILSDSVQMLELFEELYGDTQARGLLRILQDGQWESLMSRGSYEQIVGLLNLIRNHYKLPREISSAQTLRKKDVDFYETANIENFSLAYKLKLIETLAHISRDLKAEIDASHTDGARRLYLMRVQNMLEPFVFGLINTIRDSWEKLTVAEQKKALSFCLELQTYTMAEGDGKEKIRNIIKNLKAIDPNEQPTRYFQQVLTAAERELTLLADAVSAHYQRRADNYATMSVFKHEGVKNFSANMIRESVLFTVSLLANHAADQFAEKNKLPRWHITRTGTAAGRLIRVSVLDQNTISALNLTTDDVLVTENIPDDIAMPRVAAILTRQVEDSLSHLAIMAGYYGIPWASLPPSEFDKLITRAKERPQVVVTISQSNVSISDAEKTAGPPISATTMLTSGVSVAETPKISVEVPSRKTVFLVPDKYERGRSGTKAYNLKEMRDVLPGLVPEHVSSPFEYFRWLIENDQTLKGMVEELYQFKDPQSIQVNRALVIQKLEAIQRYINEKLEIPAADQAKLLQGIQDHIGKGKKIILRSTTSVEDLAKYPAAGVYESKINDNLGQLISDFKWVFSQFYSIKAFEERRRQGFDESQSFPGILIQELIDADYSFVIHTRDPNSPNPDEMIIEIAIGLGPALMTGKKEYAGTAHSFSYNIRTGQIKRLSYANKSVKATSKGDRLIDYADDKLSKEEIPGVIDLKQLFEMAARIKASKVGNGIDQDIEGVIVLSDTQNKFRFVQSRNQANITAPTFKSEQMTEEGEKVLAAKVKSSQDIKTHPPIFYANPFAKAVYNLPTKKFNGSGANLVDLWLEAFRKVAGAGRVIVTPYGSLSYMMNNGQMLWDNIEDFDLFFYVVGASNREAAFEFQEKYFKDVQKEFKALARAAGLLVQENQNGDFSIVSQATGHTYEMKAENLKILPLTEITRGQITRYNSGGFLHWYNYYGDPEAEFALQDLLVSERELTLEQAVTNAQEQYRLIYLRAQDPEELKEDPSRILREMFRISWIFDDRELRRRCSELLSTYGSGEAAVSANALTEAAKLWETLPKPDEPGLRDRISAQAQKKVTVAADLVQKMEAFLSLRQIMPGNHVYYAFAYQKDKRVEELVAYSLLQAYMNGAKFHFVNASFPQCRDGVKKHMMDILARATPSMSLEERLAYVDHIISMVLVNYSHHYQCPEFRRWLMRYPELKKQEDEGQDVQVMDMVMAYLNAGNRMGPQDVIAINHIDIGSTFSMLPLLISRGSYDKRIMTLLQQAADVYEKPSADIEHAISRVGATGERVSAQKLVFSFENLIHDVGYKNMSEKEAIAYMQGEDGTPQGSVLGQLIAMANELVAKGRSLRVEELSRSRMANLRAQFKRLERAKRAGELGELFSVSENDLVTAIDDRNGIQDVSLKYAFSSKNTKVLVQYSESRIKGERIGWRYYSIGRNPNDHTVNLTGLMAVLNSLNEKLHGSPRTERNQRWTGKAHEAVVIFGPVGNSRDNTSLIPPDMLISIIDLYVRYTAAKKFDLSEFQADTEFIRITNSSNTNRSSSSGVLPNVVSLDKPEAGKSKLTGGKGSSLYHLSRVSGVLVPPGFAVSTEAYKRFVEVNNIAPLIVQLDDLSKQWIDLEKKRKKLPQEKLEPQDEAEKAAIEQRIQSLSDAIREKFVNGKIPDDLKKDIVTAYEELGKKVGQENISVAVRSSATTEDMAGASFAGQYDSFLNQTGVESILESVKKVFASLFTDRSIQYRNELSITTEEGFQSHCEANMAAVVQVMVPTVSAGVALDVTPEGEPDIYITAVSGAGEQLVGGEKTADIWIVDRNTMSIKKRFLKGKEILQDEEADESQFAMDEARVIKIAEQVKRISDYYREHFGTVYIDTEFANGKDGKLYFVQARPETVWSSADQLKGFKIVEEDLRGSEVLFEGGICAFPGAAHGKIRVIKQPSDIEDIEAGDVVIATNLIPQYAMALDRVSAIVVEEGAPTSHAAIIGREKHKPTIIGANKVIEALSIYNRQEVTVDATTGRIYKGKLRLVETILNAATLKDMPSKDATGFTTRDILIERAGKKGGLIEFEDGLYIRRPVYKLAPLQLDLLETGIKQVAGYIGLTLRTARRGNFLYVNIDDLANMEDALRAVNVGRLEEIFTRMHSCAEEYARRSQNISPDNISELIPVYIEMLGWIRLSNSFGVAVEDRWKEVVSRLPSEAQELFIINMTESESEGMRLAQEKATLLRRARETPRLFQGTPEQAEEALRREAPEFYRDIVTFTRSYRFGSPTWQDNPPISSVIKNIQKDLAAGVAESSPHQTQQVEHPDLSRFAISDQERDELYRRWKLLRSFTVENDNQTHLLVRGQWRFLDVLKEIELRLLAQGKVKNAGQIFSMPLSQLRKSLPLNIPPQIDEHAVISNAILDRSVDPVALLFHAFSSKQERLGGNVLSEPEYIGTIDINDLPCPTGVNIAVFVPGFDGMEQAGLGVARGQIQGINFLYSLPLLNAVTGKEHPDMAFVTSAAFYNREGKLVYGNFKTPIRIDAVVHGGFRREQETHEFFESRGIPVLNSWLLREFGDDKIAVKKFFDVAKIRTAPYLVPNGAADVETIQKFIAQYNCKEIVFKPRHGKAGKDIEMLAVTDMEKIRDYNQYMLEKYGSGNYFIEKRISSVPWSNKEGRRLDWKSRTISVWSQDKAEVTPAMVTVNAKPYSHEPVNIAMGAKRYTFEQFCDARNFSAMQRQEFLAKLLPIIQNAAEELKTYVAGINPSVPGSELIPSVAGWDVIQSEEDGEWYFLEVNFGAIGGITGLGQPNSEQDREHPIILIAQRLKEQAAEYHSQHEPNVLNDDIGQRLCMPPNSILLANLRMLLLRNEGNQDAAATLRSLITSMELDENAPQVWEQTIQELKQAGYEDVAASIGVRVGALVTSNNQFIRAQIAKLESIYSKNSINWGKIDQTEKNKQTVLASIADVRNVLSELLQAVDSIQSLAAEKGKILQAIELVFNNQGINLRKDLKFYPIHPLQAALNFIQKLGIADPEFILSALLHDVIEDVDRFNKNPALIGQMFGANVQANVQSVTNQELPQPVKEWLSSMGVTGEVMKALEYQLGVIREITHRPETLLLKSADFSDNALKLGNLSNVPKLQARLAAKYGVLIQVFAEEFRRLADQEVRKGDTANHTLIAGLRAMADEYEAAEREVSDWARAWDSYEQLAIVMQTVGDALGMKPEGANVSVSWSRILREIIRTQLEMSSAKPSEGKTAPTLERTEKLLSAENISEKKLLMISAGRLAGIPVNEHVDISAIPKNNDQLVQNMKTLARLIAWNNTFGMNIRYILDNDPDGNALAILRLELAEIAKIPGINGENLLSRVGIPHVGDIVINIYVATSDNIKKIGQLTDKEYAIALKDDPELPGVSIPNYTAASAIGLALASLRTAKGKEGTDEYESLRRKMFEIIGSIYKRFGIIKDDKEFTITDLEFMVTGCFENKIKYAILYALPPIVKDMAERLQRYHEVLHLILQAA